MWWRRVVFKPDDASPETTPRFVETTPRVVEAPLGSDALYDTLLLEGGAVKGVAYAGAAHVLEEVGALPLISRYAGSSAGAMAAAALCAGVPAAALSDALLALDFSQLLDSDTLELPSALRTLVANSGSVAVAVASITKRLFGGGAPCAQDCDEDDPWRVIDPIDLARRLATEYGLFRGLRLEESIEALLRVATGIERVTFEQLRRHSGGKLLRVTATSVTRQRVVYFDADSTPQLAVARAVRASCAIPILFAPVLIEGELFVDGGALRNLPHDAFERPPPPPKPMFGRVPVRHRTLALSIRTPTEAQRSPGGTAEIVSLASFAALLFETLTWGEGSANCTAKIAGGEIDLVELGAWAHAPFSALDFNLTRDDKLAMLNAGRENLARHLASNRHYAPLLKHIPEVARPRGTRHAPAAADDNPPETAHPLITALTDFV